MPTTRHRRSRGRTILTLDSLSLPAILSLVAGWRPPSEHDAGLDGPWQTWAEFDACYQAVRDEFLNSDWANGPGVPFAERRYQEVNHAID